jgi:hypothetical protein
MPNLNRLLLIIRKYIKVIEYLKRRKALTVPFILRGKIWRRLMTFSEMPNLNHLLMMIRKHKMVILFLNR